MNMTYEEYIDFLNHLMIQEFLDFDSREGGSTSDALTIIGE